MRKILRGHREVSGCLQETTAATWEVSTTVLRKQLLLYGMMGVSNALLSRYLKVLFH